MLIYTHPEPGQAFLPRSYSRFPDEIQNLTVKVHIPTVVSDRERKRDGGVRFRHVALPAYKETKE